MFRTLSLGSRISNQAKVNHTNGSQTYLTNSANTMKMRQAFCKWEMWRKTITFQIGKKRKLFAAFPEVVLIDATHGTNENRYKLLSFMVHDIFGKVFALLSLWTVMYLYYFQNLSGLICAPFSARAKIHRQMTDAATSFNESNPTWSNIKVIVVDKGFTERVMLMKQFPDTQILLCQFHVIAWLDRKVSKRIKVIILLVAYGWQMTFKIDRKHGHQHTREKENY